jgi:PAS domain S-box-containing protein
MTVEDSRWAEGDLNPPPAGAAEALLAASPDGVVVIDRTGSVVLTNPAVDDLFGYGPGELVGQPVEVLLPAAIRAGHVAQREAYALHPRTRPMGAGLQLVGRRRDGTEIAVDVSLAPVPSPNGALYGAFVRDATEQRRAQARLNAVNDISQALLAGETSTALWTMTARHARRLGGATWTSVVVESDEPGMFVVAAGDGDGIEALIGRGYPGRGTFAEPVLAGTSRVVVADLEGDPRATEMGRAIGVGPAAAVAVAETKRQFGTLLVGRRRGDPVFAAADIAAIEAFAASAAVALALGEARADLERLSIVEEHDRIARDLHDTVIQRLFATGMGLAAVQGLIDEPVAGRIGQAVEDLDDTIREIRSTIFDLQQSAGASGGLRRQVRALVADASAHLGFTPRLAFDGPVDTMVPEEVIVQLLPVVREALSNVVRHAQAGAVDVVVSLVGGDLVLTVGDDGIGPAGGRRSGNGLRNMASRADQLDGRFTMEPRDPRGTVVEWRAPIR